VTALLVALGAALGAPLRYLVDRAVGGHDFPWGTFAVNVAGSFLLGLLAGGTRHASAPLLAFAGTGFCGALTTYSTFGYETVRLIQEGAQPLAVLNVVGSVVAGLAAAVLGVALI